MRALVCTALDGPDALEVREVDDPKPTAPDGGELVVVDVTAAGVAYPDLLLTRGQYQMKLEPPFVPGVEVAGVVASAPEHVHVSPGDRVMAYTTSGGLAERVAVDFTSVLPTPDELSDDQAAGFVMNHHTAHFALHRRGRLAVGEKVLVHGAAGGLGTAAIQVAKGADTHVIAVASTESKRDLALRVGAHDAVSPDGFLEAVRELTDGVGVDVVVDPVGGDRFLDSIRLLKPEGRLLVLGFTAGSIPEVRVNRLLLNNVSLVGVAWGAFLASEPQITEEIQADLTRLVADGAVNPVVGEVFDLDSAAEAFRRLESREALGKLVVRLAP